MRSRTSYFNATVFSKHLKTLWPLAAAYMLLLLLAPFLQVTLYTGDGYYAEMLLLSRTVLLHNHLLLFTANAWPAIYAAYGTALGMGLFAYLMNPRLSTGLHALPLRRESHLLSALAAGGTYILAPNLLIAGLLAGVTAANGLFTPAVFTWLLVSAVMGLFGLCLFALCAQATGSGIFAALLAVVMHVLFPVCEQFIRLAGSEMLYGVEAVGWRLTVPLSPVLYLAHDYKVIHFSENNGITPDTFIAWGYVAGVVVVTILLVGLALLLYRRRPLESAGDVIAHPFLRPVFRIAMAAGCGLVLGCLVQSIFFHRQGWVYLSACIVLCAAIGYTGAEMLMGKTFRVMKKIWPRLAALCAAILCLCIFFGLDALGLARRLPAVDMVREAQLNVRGHNLTLSDPQAIARLQAANLAALDEGPYDGDESIYCYIDYYTHDSMQYCARRYFIDGSSDALADPQSAISRMIALLSDPQLILASLGDLSQMTHVEVNSNQPYSGSGTLAGQDARALLAAMEADIRSGTLGRYRTWEEERALEDAGQIYYLYLFTDTRDAYHPYWSRSITVYPDCTETMAFLEAWQP